MWLSDSEFHRVIASTPLVSLDFVVRNERDEWLLGRRLNRPARHHWFVPGGRVRKNETLEAAARRLSGAELGHEIPLDEMAFLGVYQHFYHDSMPDAATSTHYVVLAYHFRQSCALEDLPRAQHGDYRWVPADQIATAEDVHANTRAYLPSVTALQPNTEIHP